MNSEDGQVTLFVYCNFLVLLSTTVCSQNINKQNVNIADETLTDYNFLSRYHYTKSNNYLKRRYQIRHRIPMFIGTPCSINIYSTVYMYFCNQINVLYNLCQQFVKPMHANYNLCTVHKGPCIHCKVLQCSSTH